MVKSCWSCLLIDDPNHSIDAFRILRAVEPLRICVIHSQNEIFVYGLLICCTATFVLHVTREIEITRVEARVETAGKRDAGSGKGRFDH